MSTALKWTAAGISGLVVLVLAFAAWVLATQWGARWSMEIARNVLDGRLDAGAVQGTILGPLTITDLRYRDPAAGVDVRAKRIAIDLALADLLRAVVHVKDAELSGIDVLLKEPSAPRPAPEAAERFDLQPPVDVVIDSLVVSEARIRRPEAPAMDLTRAVLIGHWTEAELAIRRLQLQSPQGDVHFGGRVAQKKGYVGEGRGRFRWQADERTYAGALKAVAEGNDATLALTLTSPLKVQLEALLEQSAGWPWRFTLEVPRFDPRESLMPDAGLESLAAALSGQGSLERGTISGRVLIDGEPLHLEALQFTRSEKELSIASMLRIGAAAGVFNARGDIDLTRDPWTAAVDATWRDVVIPAEWAGQELHTRGQLDLVGGTQAYTAKGTLALGPPGRMADIVMNVAGSPAAIDFEQLDIVEASGRLAARGRLDLQPKLAWNIAARADGFDPGAFAAAWRGDVDFDLASEGRMTAEGPTAALRLDNLSGELRGRPLRGSADLALTPARVLSGALALKSGASELRFRGQPGEQIDATVSLNIASLGDWMPDAGGVLTAGFVVRGRWPELSIVGDARGSRLNAANVRIDELAFDAQIDDARDPQGSLRLDLTELAASGFKFETVRARAHGAPDAHRLDLHAAGEPLALELELKGARTQGGWSGSLPLLVLEVQDAARVALREPVLIEVARNAVEISRACLAQERIELCASGSKQPDGAMQGSYSLASVPLALANVLAPAGLPLKLAGLIQGRGEIRRTPGGELFGEMLIQSPSGRLSHVAADSEKQEQSGLEQTLLSYDDLRVTANLSGSDARATLSARLQRKGSLRAAASLRGVGQPETAIAGDMSARIPDLAPLAAFMPQVANLHGRGDAQGRVAGTLQAPDISGLLNVADLAADVPALGLHLKDGRLQARPVQLGEVEISGGVASGDGRIEFAGRASTAGKAELNINGDRFLAADIPAARVLVTPDLELARTEGRMTLSGDIGIPEATVNLQKLPRGGNRVQQASPDVVVVDAKTRQEEVAQAPLFADVTVVLGEKVQLTGFGLQAQVEGRLDVRESPGEPALGSGEVRVTGTYKAYGQDLTIRQGQLLYAATPLDNPRLNIEATRQVEDVTAGLRVQGSAQSPELTIFSDPPMAQASALSYLVAGKPLEEIGADESEADTMQAAAQSLGTAAGGLLAKSVGRRLGVDDFAVRDEELLGGSALTVGQYLSPRLYLSYGVGMFEPGDVVTLRYRLSEDLALKTQRGPESTRAGIEYRVER